MIAHFLGGRDIGFSLTSSSSYTLEYATFESPSCQTADRAWLRLSHGRLSKDQCESIPASLRGDGVLPVSQLLNRPLDHGMKIGKRK